MQDSAILNRLKHRQAQFALDSLRTPGDRSEYEFGYRVGVVAGYEKAMEEILALLKEERDNDRFS